LGEVCKLAVELEDRPEVAPRQLEANTFDLGVWRLPAVSGICACSLISGPCPRIEFVVKVRNRNSTISPTDKSTIGGV